MEVMCRGRCVVRYKRESEENVKIVNSLTPRRPISFTSYDVIQKIQYIWALTKKRIVWCMLYY